jgi:hypothetical protein
MEEHFACSLFLCLFTSVFGLISREHPCHFSCRVYCIHWKCYNRISNNKKDKQPCPTSTSLLLLYSGGYIYICIYIDMYNVVKLIT